VRLAARFWLALLAVAPAAARAAEIVHTDVTHEDGRYRVRFEVRLEAEAARVMRHLTDYAHLTHLSDSIVESRVLDEDSETKRVHIALRACVLFVCRTVRRTVDVEALPDGNRLTLTDPAGGDFHYSVERWQVLPEGGGTRLRYTAEAEPSFFVPPLIGPWLVKGVIRRELATTAARLEELARHE
jgi:hypothetical protein